MKQIKQNGITLIALVITIIVLLILAGVAIATLTGDNGILTKAVEAKEKAEIANETEKQRLELLEKQLNAEGKITVSTLKVGDYVKYGDKLTSQSYVTNSNGEPDTGYETPQTFNTDTNTLWRVINKKSNGDIEIVAVKNTLSNDGITGLYLKSQKGFLNAETILNNLCSKLYSNPTYGTARSINVDDINNLTKFNPDTSDWDGKDHYLENKEPMTYTSGGPFWDKNTNTVKMATAENPVTVYFNHYKYTVNENMPLYDTLIAETKTYTGDYSEKNYPIFYWLASRSVGAYTNHAYFRMFSVYSGSVNTRELFNSTPTGTNGGGWLACAVRPIVTLNANLELDINDETKDGSEQSKAWILK